MSWEDVIKIYSGRSNMEKAKKVEAKLETMFDALKAGELDDTIRFAKNEGNFRDEDVESLKLSKEELIEIFKALLVGVDGLIDVAGDQIMDDDGDRAFASQFER